MARKRDDQVKQGPVNSGGKSSAVARETASGRFVASPTSKRVIKATSAAHREALKRLVDR